MVLGGPVLFLVGESLFRLRVTGVANAKRLAVAALLVLLAPLGVADQRAGALRDGRRAAVRARALGAARHRRSSSSRTSINQEGTP